MSRHAAKTGEEFEPGSKGRVLRNKLGILDPFVAERIETSLLAECYARRLSSALPALVLDCRAIRDLHADWFSPLYPFAGRLREVNVSKDGFLFAPLAYLDQGLAELDGTLARLMPCAGLPLDELCEAIAVVHAEILLLHPFREGNGRVGRLVADITAAQGGYRPLAWRFGEPGRRERYLAAMHRGYVTDYAPLAGLVREALLEGGREAPPP